MHQVVTAELTKDRSEERLARWLAVGVAAALIALAAGIDFQLRLAPAEVTTGPAVTQFDSGINDADALYIEQNQPAYDRSDLQLSQG